MKRKPMVQHKSGDQVEARKRSGGKLVIVNNKMQQGYRYALVEPIGRNFDPEFKPELTPKEMLALGIFGGKYMTDCRKEFPSSWFTRAKALAGRQKRHPQLFWCRCEPTSIGVASERLAARRRSARLVPMVLPLLHGTTDARGGQAPDQAPEGVSTAHCADHTELRAGGSLLQAAPAAGITALGVRQPQDLNDAPGSPGAVARLVGIESGVVSGVFQPRVARH